MQQGDPWGVAHEWWGTDGTRNEPSEATRAALHLAMGAAEHPTGPPPGPPTWFVPQGRDEALRSPATIELEDGTEVRAPERLPPDLPLGAHLLRPDDDGPATNLFVVAPRSPRARRSWGWSTQLYATRSAHSWGIGDLGDLADLAFRSLQQGAGLLAHSPLGAPLPVARQQPSPYYASTRRFCSPLHLRVDAVPGADLAGPTVERAAAAGRALNAAATIDRDLVWRIKLDALEAIWSALDATQRARALEADDEDDEREAVAFAHFNALSEHHGSGWSSWPTDCRHPDASGTARFGTVHRDRVDFWCWVQRCCDEQLAAAAAAGAPLMADLPVGFDPDGFDAWVDQDLLASGVRIGAPPDDFNSLGQDWGLPPYVPWRLRAAGYRPWISTLRRVLRHAGSLRIDHVMGLFRLYLIPPGAPADHGAYVLQYGTELLDLAVTEAARAGATLVGEDLGTVEPGVREAMGERDVYGYRIGWFAEEPPEEWPATTLAALTTHDLPTAVGLWDGQDALDRRVAGVPDDPDGDDLLRRRLARLARVDRADPKVSTRSVVLDAHASLSRSGSDLVVATLEDAVGAARRPNLPGTVDEHPNWSTALPIPLEQLGDTGADQLAEVLRGGRELPEQHRPDG